MACVGTSSAAAGATSLSITYQAPRPIAFRFREVVAIGGGGGYNYCTAASTATPHPHSPKLIIQPYRNTTTRNHCCYNKKAAVVRAEAAEAEIMAPTEISGIKIINNPPESKLTEIGVRSWPKWGCPPSKFPWTYSSKETCYLLKGKVKVYPDGSDEAAEFCAGDLVEFPKGMSCTWEVSEAVDKHYKFD